MPTVLDLPQLYTKPSTETFLYTLDRLATSSTINAFRSSDTDSFSHFPASETEIDETGIPAYLTSIISSPLKWITSEEAKVRIWEAASARLSERSGRSGLRQISRTFRIPSSAISEGDQIEVVLKEPSLTADNLGHKTWLASYLLARRLAKLFGDHGMLSMSDKNVPLLLELGSGTGLLGIAAAGVCHDIVLQLTDLPSIVGNLKDNVEANRALFGEDKVPRVEVLDWSLVPDQTQSHDHRQGIYDTVMAADPLYSPEHPKWLVNAVIANLKSSDSARAIVELPLRRSYMPEMEDFQIRMLHGGLQLIDQGTETGFEDWEDVKGDRLEVECWWGIWKWEAPLSD